MHAHARLLEAGFAESAAVTRAGVRCVCLLLHQRTCCVNAVCVCGVQVKVAPASSCVSGRIDHLIQIKDSPSARGRDELVTPCKMETYCRCRALVSEQELLSANIPPVAASFSCRHAAPLRHRHPIAVCLHYGNKVDMSMMQERAA